VNNTAHDGSDLDLVIRTKNNKPLTAKVYANLQEKITQSNQIEKQNEVLYSNIN